MQQLLVCRLDFPTAGYIIAPKSNGQQPCFPVRREKKGGTVLGTSKWENCADSAWSNCGDDGRRAGWQSLRGSCNTSSCYKIFACKYMHCINKIWIWWFIQSLFCSILWFTLESWMSYLSCHNKVSVKKNKLGSTFFMNTLGWKIQLNVHKNIF